MSKDERTLRSTRSIESALRSRSNARCETYVAGEGAAVTARGTRAEKWQPHARGGQRGGWSGRAGSERLDRSRFRLCNSAIGVRSEIEIIRERRFERPRPVLAKRRTPVTPRSSRSTRLRPSTHPLHPRTSPCLCPPHGRWAWACGAIRHHLSAPRMWTFVVFLVCSIIHSL